MALITPSARNHHFLPVIGYNVITYIICNNLCNSVVLLMVCVSAMSLITVTSAAGKSQ